MFTVLPTLYLIGRDLFRRWKTNTVDDEDSISSETRKIRRKKCSRTLRRYRRQICTDKLLDDDIDYLLEKTEFSREQILAWHEEFLVKMILTCSTFMIEF